jgi:serine/threonine protein kinase
MPESEPKPRLIELVGPGASQGWKAVLKNGKPAVLHEIPVPPAEAAAAIPRLQRLAEHRHPALSPVLAWGTDPNGVWVAVEPNEGTPLSTLLSRGPLTPPAAASLGAAVLSGVAALHEAGIAMGGFGATAIRVTANGEVRLAGHPAAAVRGAPAQSDLRADVRSCGMAVCAAFGVDPAGAPAPPNVPPGLVVTMRSMASGAMGPAADRAQGALREMAAALLAPDRMVAAQAELATRAGGREMPSVTPFLPQGAAPAVPAAPAARTPTVPPVPRAETPVRAPVSYDAPPRPMQTYPGIPAPIFTPPGPAAAPVPPPAPPEPRQSPVPTWSDPPAKPPSPFEAPAAPAAMTPPAPLPTTTNPPAPAPVVIPPATSPFTPTGTRSPFETAVPTPAPSTIPPPSSPLAPPSPPPASQSTWTPVEQPTWTPGPVETSAEPPPWVPGEAGVAAAAAAAAAASGLAAANLTPTPPPSPAYVPSPSPTYQPAPAPVFAPAYAPAPTPARQPTVARRPARGGSSERPTWLIPAVIAVVVILLLGTIGGIILANRGKSNGGTAATSSPTAKTSPKTSPQTSPKTSPTPTTKAPLAVPNFGPNAAAPITTVIICSTATPCNISGSPPEIATACDLTSCHVEVGIYFSSAQKVPVAYVLKFFDRCTGTTTDLPGPNAYTPPGYLIVIPVEKWPVTLPSGVKSGALVAVAQQPTVAASAPLMLGGDSCA